MFSNKLHIKLKLTVIFSIFVSISIAQEDALLVKYNNYRDRLLSEWILISPEVEQFGVNIPAVDRRVDSTGKPVWVSWSDGNSNFNHWFGILATEYRLLKNNHQDYNETLKMLIYSLIAIERLDLYSEYCLRKQHNLLDTTKPEYENIKYPDDINGFLLRDDVSLGFWRQYHDYFNADYGWHNGPKDGTNKYLSVFQRGVIQKEGMSQDNIIYMLQSLALVKYLVDNEPIKDIEVNFLNNYIPRYLNDKEIIINDSVYFDKWIDDLTDRLVSRMQHPYPEQEIVLNPIKGKARPSKSNFGGLMHSRWYIMNPITNNLVAEGNGEDMGVWMNSYGVAEAANFITGRYYHLDNSDKGMSEYIFKALLFKNMKFLKFGGFPIPDPIDDYMFRALASVGDINWKNDSYNLLFLLGDKRERWTYEHNTLILFILHRDKYEKIYNTETTFYNEDEKYYKELLMCAPASGPSTDYSRVDYSPFWSSSSRLNWPENRGNRNKTNPWEYAGMDYMFLFNLYRLVFEPSGYKLKENGKSQISDRDYLKYRKPNMQGINAQFYYMPPIKK
jgi:hypothetical protein